MIDIGKNTILARVLSGENVHLNVRQDISTAYFDLNTRTIQIPSFMFEDENFETMVMAHEISHCIYTPYDEWMDFINNVEKIVKYDKIQKINPKINEQIIKNAINIVEDVRIDKLIQIKYPGLKKYYNKSTDFIYKTDFFKINNTSKISKMSFLNKLCVYSKYDSRNPKIPYGIQFSKEEMEFVERIFNLETFKEVEDITIEILETFPVLDTNENFDQSDSSTKSDDSKQSESESNEENREDCELPERMNIDESFIGNEGNEEGNIKGPTSNSEKMSSLYDLWQSSMNTNIAISNSFYNKENVKTIAEITTFNSMDFRNKTNGFISDADLRKISDLSKDFNSYVNKFSNKFNLKKRAKELTNNNIKNSGILDSIKIHKYKYDDNIFLNKMIENNQKNHGFIFLVDCSGSMADIFPSLTTQLFAFYKICEKIDVPYAFYGYTSGNGDYFDKHQNKTNFKSNNICFYDFFKKGRQKRLIYENFSHIMNGNISLGGTPTSDALLGIVPEIKSFQRKFTPDILNLVIFTDGADGTYMDSSILKYNGTYYKNSFSPRGVVDNVSALYRLLRDHYNVRITHIDITNNIPSTMLTDFENEFFKKEKFLNKSNFGGADNVIWLSEKLIKNKDVKVVNSLVEILA